MWESHLASVLCLGLTQEGECGISNVWELLNSSGLKDTVPAGIVAGKQIFFPQAGVSQPILSALDVLFLSRKSMTQNLELELRTVAKCAAAAGLSLYP